MHPKKGFSFRSNCNFIEKETLAQVFSCEFYEIFKNKFFIEHIRSLPFMILMSQVKIVLVGNNTLQEGI